MANRPLGKCPTCRRDLPDEIRAAMGLRNGELLNSLCPGRNGPSDIDHVIHNGRISPERVMFLEYKDGPALEGGQKWLLDSLRGDWQERSTGRLLSIRYHLLGQHDSEADHWLNAIVNWVWPGILDETV